MVNFFSLSVLLFFIVEISSIEINIYQKISNLRNFISNFFKMSINILEITFILKLANKKVLLQNLIFLLCLLAQIKLI